MVSPNEIIGRGGGEEEETRSIFLIAEINSRCFVTVIRNVQLRKTKVLIFFSAVNHQLLLTNHESTFVKRAV